MQETHYMKQFHYEGLASTSTINEHSSKVCSIYKHEWIICIYEYYMCRMNKKAMWSSVTSEAV